MPKKPLRIFFEKHVEGTPEKGTVTDDTLLLTNLMDPVLRHLGIIKEICEVSITTRAIKHMYDKKPAEEFNCLLDGLDEIVQKPICLYENKTGRRGDYCLVGTYQGIEYICSLEFVKSILHIVTAFRKRDEKYLAKCALLWSREVGNPPSQPIDAPEGTNEHPQ